MPLVSMRIKIARYENDDINNFDHIRFELSEGAILENWTKRYL